MCDSIHIEFSSIRSDGACLCCSTPAEIFNFVFEELPINEGEGIYIHRDYMDYYCGKVFFELGGAGDEAAKNWKADLVMETDELEEIISFLSSLAFWNQVVYLVKDRDTLGGLKYYLFRREILNNLAQ